MPRVQMGLISNGIKSSCVISTFDRFINRANSRRHNSANIVTQIASVVVHYSSRNTECRQLSSPVMTLTFDLFNPSSLPLQRASTLVITLSLDHPATLSIVQLLVVDYHWFYHEFLLSITGALWFQLLAHPTNVLTYLLYLLLASVQALCVFSNIDGGKFHICTSLIFSGVVWNYK